MTASAADIVYALHDFEAENEDELSFMMGSKIIILERDDQYGDGWYQGKNEAGEVGLFPQSYTSPTPPSPEDRSPSASVRAHTPEPVIAANMNEVQQALASLQVQRTVSIKSGATADSDDEDDDQQKSVVQQDGLGAGHRATLAAIAAQNAEKAQREEKERAEQRRRDDEAAYEKARQEGLIDGLQMSDESDDEEAANALRLPVGMKDNIANGNGHGLSNEVKDRAATADETSAPPPVGIPTISEPALSLQQDAEAASMYAESTYSEHSFKANGHEYDDAAVPMKGAEDEMETINVDPTAPRSLESSPLRSSAGLTANAAEDQNLNATPKVDSSSKLGSAAAIGAGAAGIAAAGAALHHATSSSNGHPATTAEQATATVSSLTSGGTISAAPITETPSPLSPFFANRSTTPEPSSVSQATSSPSSAVFGIGNRRSQDSPAHSLRSSAQSTRQREATDGSLGSAGFSNGATQVGTLPYDPRLWGVEEVCEWGTSKGFDALTLAKFREHEISGDVLVEMDVAMLKEIDLVAFGRRVHIYNAIKELKARIAPSRQDVASPSILSPAMSGYEPDTPSSMGFASPAQYQPASFGSASQRASMQDLHGLGFDPNQRSSSAANSHSDAGSLKASASSNQLSNSQSSSTSAPTGAMTAGAVALAAGGAAAAAAMASNHRRSTTAETARESIGPESLVTASIPEEAEDSLSATTSTQATPMIGTTESIRTTKSNKRPKPSPSNRRVSESEQSLPPSPTLNGGSTSSTSSKLKKDSGASDRTFFGTIGRSRKPPPRVSVSDQGQSSDGGATPRPGSSRAKSALNQAKRSTRLFGSFGGQSGSSGGGVDGRLSSDRVSSLDMSASARKRSSSTFGASRDAPSSMSPKTVEQATSEMVREEVAPVEPGGRLLEKIGNPDYSGWMQKRGDKYNTWKQRFFVLKGVHLYYLKSESEQRVKGFINLKGYRVISDPNIHAGQYGFKIVHDYERAHLFSASEQYTIRNWMREIMKATIGRNYDDVVVSSCDIDTMPLTIAQTMYPPPRPPSPSERARVQREKYGDANPNTLTPADAQKLMDFTSGSPLMATSPASTQGRKGSTFGSVGNQRSSKRDSLSVIAAGTGPGSFPAEESTTPTTPTSNSRSAPPRSPARAAETTDSTPTHNNSELLAWVNSKLPGSAPTATDLGPSLSSGQTLVRLVEHLSGKQSDISDTDFAKYKPIVPGQPMDVEYFDTVFNIFDYLSPIVSTDEISMSDLLSGNEPRLTLLVSRIKAVFEP